MCIRSWDPAPEVKEKTPSEELIAMLDAWDTEDARLAKLRKGCEDISAKLEAQLEAQPDVQFDPYRCKLYLTQAEWERLSHMIREQRAAYESFDDRQTRKEQEKTGHHVIFWDGIPVRVKE